MRLKNIGALSLIKGVGEMQFNKKNIIQRQGQRIFYIISKKTKKNWWLQTAFISSYILTKSCNLMLYNAQHEDYFLIIEKSNFYGLLFVVYSHGDASSWT